ncbi:AAA+-type ATPase, SpoVK/Ycf46/Vps4 family [Prevotella aff. ruminicola Tc2-24]|jgi:SpoVK/Ycf46/Vps4 family AAA+-type ATPase|uniref:AAA+-type ATPase, SpoVK/Ycf46/Vps4 family n=1 Tax=Prevotella aff. ruminicola Tc2-24 TaxID=81582 RepID=A0A1I0PW58_9BACT|nr:MULTISPECIES: AAA family ATPase [Prevotella]MBR5990120.1 AAA family ATPase [Prevotella sp.]SEE60972.1 AAA+-type ATPase, SpoVK/Ycf46/Vps4 family [Prevotella sp. lc2012]SEW18703.1 AAA+-type ATPase, SpoVK/Ycf46/Vps4 family [Prevotella aff. ruminicola Tc2-24]
MICENCHKENRGIAKFCKWCGKPLVSQDLLDKLVGLDEVKRQLKTIVDTYAYLRSRKDIVNVRISVNAVIIGETGTGKTALAEILRDYFYQHKIIEKPKLTMVDAVDYQRFVDKWDDNIKKAKNGILFFDNVQKLLPDKYSNQVNPLDKLFVEMDKWDDNPVVIISGLSKGLEDFLESNPAVANRFKYTFRLPTPGYHELTDICKKSLRMKYGVMDFSAEADNQLMRYFKYQLKIKDETFGNGHLAIKTAEDIFTHFISRGEKAIRVEKEDIQGYVPEERTVDEVLKDLDLFIGMDEVKSAVREIAYAVQNSIQRAERGLGKQEKMGMHIILTGNPGTGKTTIARKLGEILAAIGYLDSGHVVEVDRAKMVSPYQGETPKVVDRLCDKAKGGILFVDEAYTLAPLSAAGERDNQGAQALEKLMKRMEDDRGQFVVIAAGYRMEMENLFRINPGFRSRFNYFLDIKDYSPEQLYEIMQVFAKEKKYVFSKEAEELTRKMIAEMHQSRDKDFANGRTMRTLFDQICKRQAQRLQSESISTMSNEELMTIKMEDIPYETPRSVDISDCLAKLDGLVGLNAVKKEVSNLAAYLNLQIKRGETSTFQGKHYVFTGNPGTGKTTVARIMADIFKTLGIVSRGQLVEADRSKLVAGYSGQTAIKTNQLVDQAMGGVLFIDEAYTLRSSEGDSFGAEAIDTLLKRLEDDRGKFICIVAGYTDQMHEFIDSNPGLKSRFTQTIHFDDYTPDELTDIFLHLAKGKNFTIDDTTRAAIHRQFEQLYLRRDKNFGNAREARRIFDETVERQSQRLVTLMNDSGFKENDMFGLIPEDLPMAQGETTRPLDEVLNELDELIGMRTVKNSIRRLAVQSMFMKQRAAMGAGKVQQMAMNFVLTGNPGTGKTSVARKMGEVLQSMDILPTNRVLEVSRATMVGKYMGETPKIVNALCDKAMGGVLFIDEAYMLGDGGDQYGKEAIDTLIKRMEDDRGKFVVIAAGYRDKMEEFLQMNPGLASRFTHKLHIDDYNEDELLAIFKQMAQKDQYTLSPTAEFKALDTIYKMVLGKDESWGNAREMRNLLDATIQRLSLRVSKMPPDQVTKETYQIILPEDI